MPEIAVDRGTATRRSYHDYQDNAWLRSVFRPLLIALVAGSAVLGLKALFTAATGWSLSYVLPLAFLAAAEGAYTTQQRGRPEWRDRRGLAFRVGELVVLLLVLRLAGWAFAGGFPTAGALSLLYLHPLLLLDDQFLAAALLLLIPWWLSIAMTADFLNLAIQPDEYAAGQSLAWGESASTLRVGRPVGRAEILRDFVRRWAWGGFLLILTSVAGRISLDAGPAGFPRLGLAGAGLSPGMLAGLIVYFLGGLLLISQARLALLRAGWFNEGIPVAPSVLRRWHITGLLALLLVAAVAALLPLGSTGGLAQALLWLLAVLVRILYTFFLLLVFLVALVVYSLHALFPGIQESEPPPPPQMDPFRPLPPPSGGLPAWLNSAMLWVVILVLVGYLISVYLRAQDWKAGPWARYWQSCIFWVRARWARFKKAATVAGATIRSRFTVLAPRVPAVAATRLTRPGRLAPRARVRYFYLSTLRRAAQRGLARPPAKTPIEFVRDLQEHWPDADLDLQALTDAFIEARYNHRAIETNEARKVEGVWARVLRALGRPGRLPGPTKAGSEPGADAKS